MKGPFSPYNRKRKHFLLYRSLMHRTITTDTTASTERPVQNMFCSFFYIILCKSHQSLWWMKNCRRTHVWSHFFLYISKSVNNAHVKYTSDCWYGGIFFLMQEFYLPSSSSSFLEPLFMRHTCRARWQTRCRGKVSQMNFLFTPFAIVGIGMPNIWLAWIEINDLSISIRNVNVN